MDSNWFLGAAGILFVVFIALTFVGVKTRRYKVVTSQPDPQTGGLVTEILIRKWGDKFNDPKDMKCFRDLNGNMVLLGNHWIIRMEEVKEDAK